MRKPLDRQALRGQMMRKSNADLEALIKKAGQTVAAKVARQVIQDRKGMAARARLGRKKSTTLKKESRDVLAKARAAVLGKPELTPATTEARFGYEYPNTLTFGLNNVKEAIKALELLTRNGAISQSVSADLERELTHLRGMHKAYREVDEALMRNRTRQ